MSDKSGGVQKREEALALMRSALLIIDEVGESADVGAHLDLAICRLEATLPEGSNNPGS